MTPPCIIVDECHRGGANDESSWRAILEYFKPAVQLGLTATPRRDVNADTYAYFGEPVYTYSLKDGINDGFLTPSKVVQVATTLDDYVYTPDDDVIAGDVEEGRRYSEADFNRVIRIREREAYRVKKLLELIDQRQKTLVFCATQEHALVVRDLINQMKASANPDYCYRVTADDGTRGEQWLRDFQDNEKTIPTVLTTSQKLSTGVDARNVRNIVLLRPVNSMIEFKQIIGRGTRLYDGKDYFTIVDFVQAHHHFHDEGWDGEPLEPGAPAPGPQPDPKPYPPQPPAKPANVQDQRPAMLQIRLADGEERAIQSMTATSFWSADGKPMSAAQFLENLFGALPAFFKDEDELRTIWSDSATRRTLLRGLADRGFGAEPLAQVQHLIAAEESDLYDVLAYVAFARGTRTRVERAAQARPAACDGLAQRQRVFVEFVLAQYVDQGVEELDEGKLPALLQLKYGGVADAVRVPGDAAQVRGVFIGLQPYLYAPTAAPLA